MAIKYSVNNIKNPRDASGKGKFYAVVNETEPISIEQIAKEIEHSTSMSEADVMGVLTALTHEIGKNILDGKSVHLGSLGYLRPTIKSKGAAREQDFNPKSMITEVKVRFKAGKDLQEALNKVEYKKVEVPKPAAKPQA